jgi:hypothetical protein
VVTSKNKNSFSICSAVTKFAVRLTVFSVINIPLLFFAEGVEPIEQGRSIADVKIQGFGVAQD